ncbi:MAG: hypothetical protein AB1490_18960 [Pseudomonadota bacterium]
MLFTRFKSIALAANAGGNTYYAGVLARSQRNPIPQIYFQNQRVDWLITPVDISNPAAGFYLSTDGWFISSSTTYTRSQDNWVRATKNIVDAGRFIAIEKSGAFLLRLLNWTPLPPGTNIFSVRKSDDGKEISSIVEYLQPWTSPNCQQYFPTEGMATLDDDFDQYFWITNTRSGGALSHGGNFSTGATLLTEARVPVYPQLWKYSGQSIVSCTNGLVVQAPAQEGSPVPIVLHSHPTAANAKWIIDQRGSIASTANGYFLHSDQATLGSAVFAIGEQTLEWRLIPCVFGPDISQNQFAQPGLSGYFLLYDASGKVLSIRGTPGSGAAVYCDAPISPASNNQLWRFDQGFLVSASGAWVLDSGADGLIVSARGATPADTQSWLLSNDGSLLLIKQPELVAASENGRVRLGYFNPMTPKAKSWYMEFQPNNERAKFTASYVDPSTPITKFSVLVQLSNDYGSGTWSKITIGFNGNTSPHAHTMLFDGPSAGAYAEVDIGSPPPKLSDLRSVQLYQYGGIWEDAWKLESLILRVNNEYYNYAFQWVKEWMYPSGLGDAAQWRKPIPDKWALNKKTWMTSGLNVIGPKKLREIVMPGSHDAGMYRSRGTEAFGQTQNLSVYEQLVEGVRYFDLRPTWARADSDDGAMDFFIYHGIFGPTLDTVLDDVARYMREGGRELVLLKFSHYDRFTNDVYGDMVQRIQTKLGPWLLTTKPSGRLGNTTINNLIQADKGTVLILCDEDYPIIRPTAGVYVYRDYNSRTVAAADITVFDRYSDNSDPNVVMSDQQMKFLNFDGACIWSPNIPCDLFLLSWTVTPNPMKDGSVFVWSGASVINPQLQPRVSATKIPNTHGQRMNILYLDYVETAQATELCMKLNNII